MDEPAVLHIHTDGASRGNPGAAAYAYVIERDGGPPVEEADCLGRMTNNQAEYTALIRALRHALELGAGFEVVVHSDSELMVRQMNGEYRVKNEELRPLYEEARDLARRFRGGVTLRHVRRSENSRADALCNEALDGKRRATPRASDFAPAGPAPARRPAAPVPLREQAVACLRRAARAWAAGAADPAPERVWEELAALLGEHGIRLSARAGRGTRGGSEQTT
jgi:ribonuclease HI